MIRPLTETDERKEINMRIKHFCSVLIVLTAVFLCGAFAFYGEPGSDSKTDIVITVNIKPSAEKRKLNEKYGISTNGNKGEHTAVYTLYVCKKKILENIRGVPFQTEWVKTANKHYLVITDYYSSSTTYTWVYSPDTGKCKRVDLLIEKDMDKLMKTSGMRFWTFNYGINSRDGSLHISGASRDGRKRCSRHYDVNIKTGQIIRKYPVVITDPEPSERSKQNR